MTNWKADPTVKAILAGFGHGEVTFGGKREGLTMQIRTATEAEIDALCEAAVAASGSAPTHASRPRRKPRGFRNGPTGETHAPPSSRMGTVRDIQRSEPPSKVLRNLGRAVELPNGGGLQVFYNPDGFYLRLERDGRVHWFMIPPEYLL